MSRNCSLYVDSKLHYDHPGFIIDSTFIDMKYMRRSILIVNVLNQYWDYMYHFLTILVTPTLLNYLKSFHNFFYWFYWRLTNGCSTYTRCSCKEYALIEWSQGVGSLPCRISFVGWRWSWGWREVKLNSLKIGVV